jgi:hypothetical protein
MNCDDNSGVGSQFIWNIDVHQSARGIASEAGHLLKGASCDSLADILAQRSGRGQCQIKEQGNKKRERYILHDGQKFL